MSKIVDIVVVNWNAGRLSLKATAPYVGYKSDIIECNVFVVDNASSDDSIAVLKDRIPNFFASKRNLGFGKACNLAFAQCKGDYVLLLNSDTESPPSTLETLVNFLETHPEYGTAGPLNVDEHGKVLRTCGRYPTFSTALYEVMGLSKMFPKVFAPVPVMTDWDHLQSRDVDHVMGSYMLIRRPILDVTGFFDEDFFVYSEDLDLSKKITDLGYKTYFDNTCSIIHQRDEVGAHISPKRLFWSIDGRRLYWKKHLGGAATFILTALSLTVEPVLRVINSIQRKKWREIRHIGLGYRLYIRKIIKPFDVGSLP